MKNVHITTKEKEVQRALGTLGIWIFTILYPHPHDVHHLCVEAPTILIARGLAQKFCKNSKGKYSVEHMFRNSGDAHDHTHMGYKPIEVIALSQGESSTPQWLANVLTNDNIAGWHEYVICERAATISGYRCVALRLYCDGVEVEGY